jgi:endonuclease YncB( thermonuclease family)
VQRVFIEALVFLMLCSNGVEATGVHRVAGPARVIDGDTLEVAGERVRLFGIDAPEKGQTCRGPRGRLWPCGRVAARALEALIAGRPVVCQASARGRYGRAIGRCLVARTDLSAWMVGAGWALAYRRYSRRYVPHECAARLARRGLWSGRFEAPWDHRRRRRLP